MCGRKHPLILGDNIIKVKRSPLSSRPRFQVLVVRCMLRLLQHDAQRRFEAKKAFFFWRDKRGKSPLKKEGGKERGVIANQAGEKGILSVLNRGVS